MKQTIVYSMKRQVAVAFSFVGLLCAAVALYKYPINKKVYNQLINNDVEEH